MSLGCEGTDHQRVYETIKASGKPCEIIHIQELGGTSAGIQAGMDAAQRLVMQISGQQRETCDISNLTMAIKCGGSDTTSGMASNCVIGYVADKLVDLGAARRLRRNDRIPRRRAYSGQPCGRRSPTAPSQRKFTRSLSGWKTARRPSARTCAAVSRPPATSRAVCPASRKRASAQSSSLATVPFRAFSNTPTRITDQKGLWIKDTPGREPEILTGMAATGAQVLMFSTGRGAPQGFCSMPVIKICGNPITYARMSHDMDLNAGRIITGEKTIEQVGEEAFEMLLKVLSGQMTKNEALSYFGSIDIYCLGPVI